MPPFSANTDAASAPVRVSVLLMTFEHEAYIGAAIESILAQVDAPPFEILIGDDCSQDGTREIVERYAAEHPTLIRPVFPTEKPGHYGKVLLSRLIGMARGDLVAGLDGDDLWSSPDKLRIQTKYMDEHPGCTLSFHNVVRHHETGDVPDRLHYEPGEDVAVTLPGLISWKTFPACSPMMRREVVNPLPDWYFEVPWGDWPLAVIAAQTGEVAYLPDVLGTYRIHPKGMHSGLDPLSILTAASASFERLEDVLGPEHDVARRELLASTWIQRAGLLLQRGEVRAAGRALRRSSRAWPAGDTRGWQRRCLQLLVPTKVKQPLVTTARRLRRLAG